MWLKAYSLVMLLIQGTVTAFFARVIVDPVAHLKGEIAYQNNPEGAVALLVFFCVLLAVIFGAPIPFLLAALIWPRRPSGWHVGICGIIAGLLTPCGWIATVPLAIYWLKPEVKAYYSPNSSGKPG